MFFHTAGPNTALVKSNGKIVIAGRTFAIPILQRVDTLNLNLRTITVRTTNGTSINGVGVDVTSCCQVKIQGWASPNSDSQSNPSGPRAALVMDTNAIKLAAQHFISKKESDIDDSIKKTVAGHQRAIIGALTIEELYRDRQAFSERVKAHCEDDMRNMGLMVVSYTVAEISDDQGYIQALGVTQTEKVKRMAVEGAATHQALARSHKGEEDAAAHLRVNIQERRMIESDKQRQLVQSDAIRALECHKAVQRKARYISEAEQDSILLVERQKAIAAEIQAERFVMEHNVDKERLLKDTEIKVDADALLYKSKIDAKAKRAKTSAHAYRLRQLATAEAAAIRSQGNADIAILQDRIKMWEHCGNPGAIMERMMEVLPEVAAAIAGPLEQTEKMVFVGCGDSGNDKDIKKLSGAGAGELQESMSALAGMDMSSLSAAVSRSHFAENGGETSDGR